MSGRIHHGAVALLALATTTFAATPLPPFSWDTTPVYQMFGGVNRLLTDDEVSKVTSTSKFHCIEKNHAFQDLKAAEKGAAREIARIKSASPGSACLFYLNSAYAYPFLTRTRLFGRDDIPEPQRSFLIEDPQTGQPARRGNVPFFDVLDPAFRAWWAEMAGTYVKETGADGLFVDQMHGFAHLRPPQRKEVQAAQVELMQMAKKAIGADKMLLLNNGAHIPALFEVGDAFMFEHYQAEQLEKEAIVADWATHEARCGSRKIQRLAHRRGSRGRRGCTWDDARYEQFSKERLTYHLAVFLIGARPHSYFQYGWGWKLQNGGLVEYPEFSKPLGAPKAEATRPDPAAWISPASLRKPASASIWRTVRVRSIGINHEFTRMMNRTNHSATRILTCALLACLAVPASAEEPKRPNIVFVITDDQGYGDLGHTGNPIIKTPHIDALAAESSQLTDYHVAPDLLAHARGAAHGALDRPHRRLAHGERPLDAARERDHARRNCSRTPATPPGMFGKWHLGDNFPYRARGPWLHRGLSPRRRRRGPDARPVGQRLLRRPLLPQRQDRRRRRVSAPTCSSSRRTVSSASAPQQTAAVLRLHRAQRSARTAARAAEVPRPVRGQPTDIAAFFGMITNIDDNVGATRELLRELGIEDNTLFIFTTDNGTATGASDLQRRACAARRAASTTAATACRSSPTGPRPAGTGNTSTTRSATPWTSCPRCWRSPARRSRTGSSSTAFRSAACSIPTRDTTTGRTTACSSPIRSASAIRSSGSKPPSCPGSGGWSTARNCTTSRRIPASSSNVIADHPEQVANDARVLRCVVGRT